MKSLLTTIACLALAAVPAGAAAQSRQKDQLRQALKDTEPKGPWIYDDISAGFAKAKLMKKPVLLVFR